MVCILRAIASCVATTIVCGCGHESHDANEVKSTSPAVSQSVASPLVKSSEVAAITGTLRQNRFLKLMATEAGFVDPTDRTPPLGQRYYTIGLRGSSRSRSDVIIDIRKFVFAQDDRGCISRPEVSASWLSQPFGESAVFSANKLTDGQLAFPVPKDSSRFRVLIAPAEGEGLIVPVGRDFSPSWPTPTTTIEDGSTLRVIVLPEPEHTPALPPVTAEHEYVVLDFVIENLSTEQGIEFTTSQQLRLVDQSGKFVQPSAATQQIGCRLDDGDVVPPGHARRLQVVYDMPPGEPRRLQYRGFEVDEVTVDLP